MNLCLHPRRSILARALLCAVLAACGAPTEEPSGTPPSTIELSGAAAGWNVLVLSVDTLRADRLGAWGYRERATSRRLDELATGGVRFERAVAPRALTWPSLASVLTGLYPVGHGVVNNGYEFAEETPTLPLLLAEQGYRTGAFLSNMCRAGHRGWQSFFCSKGVDGEANSAALAWADELVASAPSDGQVADDAKSDAPFLMWVHYFGAHSPYYNGGGFTAELTDPAYDGPVRPAKGALNRIMKQGIELGPADVAQLDAIYDASIMGTDRHAAALLDGLAQRGLMEKTIVVFLSDHGEDLYDHHGYIYHACSVYESGLHVPLSFTAPGLIPPGGLAAGAVELSDVLPTLLELLGVEPPQKLHGRSLVPALEQPAGGLPPLPAFSDYSGAPIHTVVDGDWKLVSNPTGFQPICFQGAPPGLYAIDNVELYDLASDPGETTNLAASEAERVRRLEALIAARYATIGAAEAVEQEVPEDLKDELRALGYVVD